MRTAARTAALRGSGRHAAIEGAAARRLAGLVAVLLTRLGTRAYATIARAAVGVTACRLTFVLTPLVPAGLPSALAPMLSRSLTTGLVLALPCGLGTRGCVR